MLVEFRLKNYKSYRDEQTFSLVAGSGKELPDNLIEADMLGKGSRLLRSAVVYGANASGKSNLFDAFEFLQHFVLNSANRPPGSSIGVQPFLLDGGSRSEPTEFELTFIVDGVPYRYGFSADQKKILTEWLVAYPHRLPQVWYERDETAESAEESWYFGPNLKGEKSKLKELTRPDVLFLSVAAQFNHEQLLTIYNWFQIGSVIIPSNPNWNSLEALIFRDIHQNKRLKQKAIDLVRLADLGINDIQTTKKSYLVGGEPEDNLFKEYLEAAQRIGKKASAKDNPMEWVELSLLHSSSLPNRELVALPLESQSLGTRRMLSITVLILNALEEGTVLIVDEIDSSLHPILVKELVGFFNSPELNRKNAQLVFNTHDVTLLDNKLLRRDQIWFTEKTQDGSTYLYSLQEFKPRKSEALEKNYMQGRYGAIPIIGTPFKEFLPDG